MDSNGNVIILSCVKDCEKYIEGTIKNMRSVGEIFDNYSIFFYENDSKDNTLSLLKQHASNDCRIQIISTTMTGEYAALRTWRLGEARQTLLDKIKDLQLDVNYVIVMDADDIANNEPFTGVSFIKEALQRKQHWDGCFPMLTYDLWAYRTVDYCQNYWEVRFLESLKVLAPGTSNILKNNLLALSKRFDENNLQKVTSAFNGIGIYKYDMYCKGVYSGKNDCYNILSSIEKKELFKKYSYLFKQNLRQYHIFFTRLNEECEHVSFHKSLGKNARLMCCNAIYYPSNDCSSLLNL